MTASATQLTKVVEQWLSTVLRADTALAALVGTRIFGENMPQSITAFPYVIFQYLGGADYYSLGVINYLSYGHYIVKGVDKAKSFSTNLDQINARIIALLQGGSGITPDGVVEACWREFTISYVETQQGVEYRHLGGQFTLLCR